MKATIFALFAILAFSAIAVNAEPYGYDESSQKADVNGDGRIRFDSLQKAYVNGDGRECCDTCIDDLGSHNHVKNCKAPPECYGTTCAVCCDECIPAVGDVC